MPTINSYVDREGYYIRARPSETGNITYKIKEEGNPIIWKHGLRDGDEIAWSIIQSLKALGIVYTEGSGTLGPDDFKPDSAQLKETELSEADAQELYSIITEQFKLSQDDRAEIRSLLGLPPKMDLEMIGDRIKSHLKKHIDSRGLSVRGDRNVRTTEDVEIATWTEQSGSDEYEAHRLHVLIVSKLDGVSCFTDHCIHLCEEHGLERWHVRVLETPTWEIKQAAIEQRSVIFPRLLDELRAAEFDLGDPSQVLLPLVEPVKIGSAE